MVGGSDFHLEWSVNNYSSPRPGNNDRCITAGLGSSLPRGSHEGTLVSAGITLHINALELKAVLFAVRAFTAKERQLHVHLRMENRTAVAYVLKMGRGGGGGGDTILCIGRDSPGIMGLCSDQTNYTDSRISS